MADFLHTIPALIGAALVMAGLCLGMLIIANKKEAEGESMTLGCSHDCESCGNASVCQNSQKQDI